MAEHYNMRWALANIWYFSINYWSKWQYESIKRLLPLTKKSPWTIHFHFLLHQNMKFNIFCNTYIMLNLQSFNYFLKSKFQLGTNLEAKRTKIKFCNFFFSKTFDFARSSFSSWDSCDVCLVPSLFTSRSSSWTNRNWFRKSRIRQPVKTSSTTSSSISTSSRRHTSDSDTKIRLTKR